MNVGTDVRTKNMIKPVVGHVIDVLIVASAVTMTTNNADGAHFYVILSLLPHRNKVVGSIPGL